MTDAKPLTGKRIAVTRARHQAPALEALIRECGGRPVSYPCIAIAPPADRRALDDCLRRLREFDWLLLTSGNSARAVAERLPALGIQLTAAPIRVAAAGPATAAVAHRLLSRDAQFVPADFGAGQLARGLPIGDECRILLPQSDIADESTARILRARGTVVEPVIAYRTIAGEGGADLPAMIGRGEIDAITFTSPSAVSFFRRRCALAPALNLPTVCIGPATAAAAREQGFGGVITPGRPSLNDMVSALADYFAPAAADNS